MSFMKKADKGFNPDAIITINNWRDHEGKIKVFAQSIKQLKGIDKVLLQGNAPMGLARMTMTYTYKGKEDLPVEATAELGDDEYLPFYQLKLIAGRNMVHSDSLNEMVINETLSKGSGLRIRMMQWKDALFDRGNNAKGLSDRRRSRRFSPGVFSRGHPSRDHRKYAGIQKQRRYQTGNGRQ